MTTTREVSYSGSSQDPVAGSSRLRRCTSLASSLELDSGDMLIPLGDEERPKTRRVNPQRLALRLGPDLVAEMEALIIPGAKMPAFAVRKDFQDRYCVDRRHIYDYFHSRGLRVAKEDKHTNLKRRRIIKSEQTERSISLGPRLMTEDPLQVHPGHTLTPTVVSESLSAPALNSPALPKRAATHPGDLYVKRSKKAALGRNISPTPGLPSPSTPTVVDIHAVSFAKPGLFVEASDLYLRSNGVDAFDCYEQLSDGTSLSTIDDPQDKHGDFLPPLGNSWALDQCNNLYDLLDGEYPYVYDPTHPAELYQVQGIQELFTQSIGGSFSDSDLQLLSDGCF